MRCQASIIFISCKVIPAFSDRSLRVPVWLKICSRRSISSLLSCFGISSLLVPFDDPVRRSLIRQRIGNEYVQGDVQTAVILAASDAALCFGGGQDMGD
jgi:hypothetical protein